MRHDSNHTETSTANGIFDKAFRHTWMNNTEPEFVTFYFTRPVPNTLIIVFPRQIVILNVVTRQAIICPEGPFYQAALDEFGLGN